MGIQGLLPLLEKSTKTINLSEFSGCTVAVDAYCWLHKGVYICAEKLARGEDCDAYVHYCMRLVNMLLNKKIKPILVFDGQHLPAKADTESKRRKLREQNRKKATELMRLDKSKEASSLLRRSIDVTHKMALNVIKKCREINVDCITAPFEADSQLAYLNLSGIAHLVISEDSDLLVFGCKKVVYKLDQNGGGLLIEQDKLYLSLNMQPENFTQDKFRYMCILSGCDYLPSMSGVGLKKALKFISRTQETDINKILSKFASFINVKIPPEYRDQFINADRMFQYQPIYDPLSHNLKPLNEMPDSNIPVLNSTLTSDLVHQLVLGNMDPISLEIMDNWNPEMRITPITKKQSSHKSIWSKDYQITESSIFAMKTEYSESSNLSTVCNSITKNVIQSSPINKSSTLRKPQPMTEGDILNTLDEIYENENVTEEKIVTNEKQKSKTTIKNYNTEHNSLIKKSEEIDDIQQPYTGMLTGLKKLDKRKYTVLNSEKQVVSGYFSTQVSNKKVNTDGESINPFKCRKVSSSIKEEVADLNVSFNSNNLIEEQKSHYLINDFDKKKINSTPVSTNKSFCWKTYSSNTSILNNQDREESKNYENKIISPISEDNVLSNEKINKTENNDDDEGFCSQSSKESGFSNLTSKSIKKSTSKNIKRSCPRAGLSKNAVKNNQSLLSQFGFKNVEQLKH